MFFSIMMSYLIYTVVTAFTPGPNNIVALYAVSQNGWRKGKNVLLGMAGGFLCVMFICALFCYELAKYLPSLTGTLKYVGAAYIVYLAIHVARSSSDNSDGRQMTFWKGFLLQFFNVKIILYAITVYTGYVLPYESSLTSLFAHAINLTVIGMAGFITWGVAGGLFQDLLTQYYRPFNIVMGLILVYCAITLAFGL